MGLFNRNRSATINSKFKPARSVKYVVDTSGAPAVSLDKVQATGSVNLTKGFQKAGISLSKRGLSGIRAEGVMVLDHSISMAFDYTNGTVQRLTERALGFVLNVDIDGTMPVIPFDDKAKKPVEVTLANFDGIVNSKIYRPNDMGGTNLTDALEEVLRLAKKAKAPLFCVIVTDGQPNDAVSAKRLVCELAQYPIFIKFLAIRPVAFLEELDNLPDSERLLDNVDSKFISNPAGMSDLDFADAMVDEWDSWVQLAQSAGILT